jgi:hypothetical protein
MIFRIGVVAAALLCAGCGHYVDVKAREQALQAASPSYGSVAELPFQKIDFPSDFRFSIDEKNPVIEYGDASKSDKSYVKGFELPSRGSDYQLVIRTYFMRESLTTLAMYFPIVDLLDDQKKLIKPPLTASWKDVHQVFSDELAYDRDRWHEYTLRVAPGSPIRYIVLHTSRSLVDAGGMVRAPSGAPPQVAAAVMVPIFIPSGGSGGPWRAEGCVVGDFRIYLEQPPS